MKILVFGEILFDNIGNNKYLAGAPLNVAFHLASFGLEPEIVSAIGDDNLGEFAFGKIAEKDIGTDYIKTCGAYPTGEVIVDLDKQGNPIFEIPKNQAFDFISLGESDLDKLSKTEFDCLYFGTLAQRNEVSREALGKLLKAVQCPYVFCDLNLRQNFFSTDTVEDSLRFCDMLKVSQAEADFLLSFFALKKNKIKSLLEILQVRYGIEILVITRGRHGSLVCSGNEITEISPVLTKTKNTVGAGDAFSAAFLYEYLKSKNLQMAGERATAYAGRIISESRMADIIV